MISVIILTKNLKYAVLDVPANGQLQIKEMHLICGMVQNGVKVIPYGDVLSSFETFIQNETLSVGIIPHSEFQQEGRILDFSSIELLQLSTTISLSSSGSVGGFVPPVYEAFGHPIDYGLRFKGLDFASVSAVQTFLDNGRADAGTGCNALANESGYQKISLFNESFTGVGVKPFASTNLIEIYDLNGALPDVGVNFFDKCPLLEVVDLPYTKSWHQIALANEPKSLELHTLKLPSLLTLGNAVTQTGCFTGSSAAYRKMSEFVKISIPRSFETCNAGAPHASIVQMTDLYPNCEIIYLD